jgi:hypothetical protein
MQLTGIGKKQLKNWFTNARRRIWKPLIKKQLEESKTAAARGLPPPNQERAAAVAHAAQAAGITHGDGYEDVGGPPGPSGAKRGGRGGRQAGAAPAGRGGSSKGSSSSAPPPASYGRQDFSRPHGGGKGSSGGKGGVAAGESPMDPRGGGGEGGGRGASGGAAPSKGALHSVQSSLAFTTGMPRAPSVGQISNHMKKVSGGYLRQAGSVWKRGQ